MPQQAWSNKRERQYEHIKSGLKKRGESEDTAEEIAARTVNKERARSGEAQAARAARRPRTSPRAAGAACGRTRAPAGARRPSSTTRRSRRASGAARR